MTVLILSIVLAVGVLLGAYLLVRFILRPELGRTQRIADESRQAEQRLQLLTQLALGAMRAEARRRGGRFDG